MMTNQRMTAATGAVLTLVFVAPAFGQTALTATSTVNVRTGPGTTYSVIDTAAAGQGYVGISKTSTGWWKIWFDGRTAYTHGSFWKSVSGAYGVKIVNAYLNVRKGPGTSYGIVGKVYAGQVYRIAASSGAWYRIWWGGETYYVWGGGLTKVALSGGSTTTQPPSTSGLVELKRDPAWWYKQETNYYCGPATVKMTVKYLTGRILSQSALAREMGTVSNGGTSISRSLAAIRKYTGQYYQFAAFSRTNVKYNIDRNRPVPVAFDCRYIRYAVNRDGRQSSARHISPISGYTPNGILVYDSMWGDRRDAMYPLVKMPARYATDTEMHNATKYSFGSNALMVRYRP